VDAIGAQGPTVTLTFAGDSADLEKSMRKVGDSADQMEKTFSLKGAAMAAAGAAAGAGLVAAFTDSLEFESSAAKLQAQLGAGTPIAEQAGAVAGSLYAQAYGENLGQVNEAVRAVLQSGAVMAGASNAEIESVTANVMSLADAFGQDTTGAVNAVAQMMKTGLAPNAQAALDILTVGFQQGNDKAGDLLDTFNEYGTQFRKVGLDGQTAMGLISQGLQAGARDADIVADSIKEFSIRAIDGSKSTAEGFAAIGLNAQEMAGKIAAGGPEAQAALDLTLDRIRAMKDPTDQAAAAVALFGTQAEDMGAALFALDPSEAAAKLGEFGGAAQQVNDTLADTAQNKIEGVKRGFQDWMNSIVGVQGPLGDVAAGVVGLGGDAVDIVGSLGMAAFALRGLGIATGVMTAAQWLLNVAMSANPIALVVIAIAALVAGLIWAWHSSETFRSIVLGVWDAVKGGISAAVDWVKGAIAWFGELPGKASAWFGGMKDSAVSRMMSLVDWVKGIPGRILSGLGNLGSLLIGSGRALLEGLWQGVQNALGWVKDKISGALSSIRNLFPFSPAKEGPFSGTGYTTYSGRALMEGFGEGMESANADVRTTATSVLGGAQRALSGSQSPAASGPGVSGGSRAVTFHGNTADALAKVIQQMIRTGQIQIS